MEIGFHVGANIAMLGIMRWTSVRPLHEPSTLHAKNPGAGYHSSAASVLSEFHGR